MWRHRFGGGFGPVVRQNTEWMNEWIWTKMLSITSTCKSRRLFCSSHTLWIYDFTERIYSGCTIIPVLIREKFLQSFVILYLSSTYWFSNITQYVNETQRGTSPKDTERASLSECTKMVQPMKIVKKRNVKRYNRFSDVAKHSKPDAAKVKIKSNMNARDEFLCADRVTNYVTRTHIHNWATLRY